MFRLYNKQAPAQTTGQCYVWIWLPNATGPIVCGKVVRRDDKYEYYYAHHMSIQLTHNVWGSHAMSTQIIHLQKGCRPGIGLRLGYS